MYQAQNEAFNWGDIPTWLSAVGTMGALVFAAVAAFSARKVYLIESQRDTISADDRRKRDDFERRAQAALISAWWGSRSDGNGLVRWGAYIRNASETPIYQNRVSISKLHEPDRSESFSIPVLPPTSEPAFYSSQGRGGSDENGEGDVGEFRAEITFTDSTGTRWIRDKQGRLSEVLPQLTMWTDSQRAETLQQFSGDFLSSHHVTVDFRCPPIETMYDEFLAAVAEGQTPDVITGPHDWIGALVENDLVEPVDLPVERRSAFVDKAIEAMTYNGELYGVPYAADSIALLRNLDLAPVAPRSIDEMIRHGRSLCSGGSVAEPVAIQVGEGDGFYVYPLLSSLGGKIFARTADGRWDQDALAGQSSARAFRRIVELGEKGDRVLRREINRDVAISLFVEGRTPYLLCAPWAIGPARDAGIRVAASTVPPFEGGAPARSLIAVHGFFFPTAGKNKAIARELVYDFLTRMDIAEALYLAQPRTPALAAALQKFHASDPQAAVYRRQFEAGELIPSSPDVGQVWKIFHRAEVDAVGGADVGAIMRQLGRSILDLNERS